MGGERTALPTGRQHDDVGRGEQVGDVIAGSEQPQRGAEPVALRSVAGDHDVDVGAEPIRGRLQHVEPLLPVEPRDGDDEPLPWSDAEFASDGVDAPTAAFAPGAADRREPRAAAEPTDVRDEVG